MMKKALVGLIIVMLAMALRSVVSVYQAKGRKIRLVTREVSLEVIHPGSIEGSLAVSPDSKRVVYVAKRGGKHFVVVDGVKGKKYDWITKFIFSPDSKRMV